MNCSFRLKILRVPGWDLKHKMQDATIPDYNGFHNTPAPSFHNDDDPGMVSHTWHKQNAMR